MQVVFIGTVVGAMLLSLTAAVMHARTARPAQAVVRVRRRDRP